MKRTKSPTLTSPWKVGFLVSLMLVFVSIGVTYYFVHRYGLSLGIVDRSWLDRDEWLGVLRGQGVLFEVLPLLGLVAVVSAISYLLITSAVRKYKKYLDSGLDYKHLLASLKDIGDLEDKSKIERIKNHPELKRLLLGVADTLEEREGALAEREGALETRLNDALAAKEKEVADDFAAQCERLTKALEDRALDPTAIEFSNPSLKRLSDAVRKTGETFAEPRRSDLVESYGDLRKTSTLFQSKLGEIAQELKASREGAQEIEQQLRRLVQTGWKAGGGGAGPAGTNGAQAILSSLKPLEELGASINVLSEEAKGIAISTALHAGSGTGTQDDLIRLADDVKELATRFKEAAGSFSQISGEIKTAAGGLDARSENIVPPAGAATKGERNPATLLSRVTLWVERIVVLSDKLSNLRESYELAMGTLPAAGGEPARAEDTAAAEEPRAAKGPAPDTKEAGEFEFENLERRRTIFSVEEPHQEEAPVGESPSELEPAGEASSTQIPSDRPVGDADRAGAEREDDRTTFEEMTAGSIDRPEDVEIVDREGAAERDEERLQVLGSEVFSRKKSRVPRDRDGDQEDETVDLYALGAVDYDPALHG